MCPPEHSPVSPGPLIISVDSNISHSNNAASAASPLVSAGFTHSCQRDLKGRSFAFDGLATRCYYVLLSFLEWYTVTTTDQRL